MPDLRMIKCAALACKRFISKKKLMCLGHWSILPRVHQGEIADSYTLGQDDGGQISPEFRKSVSEAVKFIAFREGVLVREVSNDAGCPDDGRGGADEFDNPE